MGLVTIDSCNALVYAGHRGCHCLRDASEPDDWTVGLCGRPAGELWLAAPTVAVAVALLSTNGHARGRHRLPGVPRIGYIRRTLAGSSSIDAAPVTGSLLFYSPVCCLADRCCLAVLTVSGLMCVDCISSKLVCYDDR